ncbi:MAG TPA: immunoglobulin domain-containing protein [Verrucomicrobiae bacterium]|nr:immunoglobulin domain-containing protein [Verrucomicrobiae bacterium]
MKKFILALLVLTGGSIFVRSEPIISQQPTDQMITNGGTVTFSVAVAGGDSFACQWQFQNTNLPTATNTTLVLAKVQPRQSGSYSVIVSNSTGTVTSSNANLTVYGIFGWGDNAMGN